MKAIRLEAHGGPEQLKLHDVPEPIPGPGEALVEVGAAGVNFMDVGVRTGQLWRHLTPPFVPGVEGAGRVIALGEGVTTLSVGQRVSPDGETSVRELIRVRFSRLETVV